MTRFDNCIQCLVEGDVLIWEFHIDVAAIETPYSLLMSYISRTEHSEFSVGSMEGFIAETGTAGSVAQSLCRG